MSIERPPPIKGHALDQTTALAIMREYERARFEKEFEDYEPEDSEPSRILGEAAVLVETTATPETLAKYEVRGRQLFHRYLREKGIAHEDATPGDADAPRFVTWLFALKPTLKATTWRMYRAAVHYYLELHIDQGGNITEAQALLERDAAIRSRDAFSGNRRSKGTRDGTEKIASSSLKMKRIPVDDMQRILSWLRIKSRSRWSQATSTWLSAGLLCGLRPSEWERTHLHETPDQLALHNRRVWLYVICAKATNGRGFATSRTIDLSTFDDESLGIIREMVEMAGKWRKAGTFRENQNSCAQLLANCVRNLWPRRKMSISLYSARHQAIANWKAAGRTRAEISVLAGHASIMTAAEKYGRKSSGWSGVKAIPNAVPEELSIANERALEYEARMLTIRQSEPRMGVTPRAEPIRKRSGPEGP